MIPFPGEVSVAGGEGQTVVVTDDWHCLEADREVQVGNHFFDDLELLVVLLTKVSLVRTDKGEEKVDDGGHSGEVSRAELPAKFFSQRAFNFDQGGEVFGIELLGGKNDQWFLWSEGFQGFNIFFEGSGIAGEVLIFAELTGIDKNRNDGLLIFLRGLFDQTEVSAMEVPHGGNKAKGFCLQGVTPGFQGICGIDKMDHIRSSESISPARRDFGMNPIGLCPFSLKKRYSAFSF